MYSIDNFTRTEAYEVKQECFDDFIKARWGLINLAWKQISHRQKVQQFAELGLLEEFKIAPGRRNPDGSYSKSEIDWNQANLAIYNWFQQSFMDTFSLDGVTTYKEVYHALNKMLDWAIEHYCKHLVSEKQMANAKGTPIRKKFSYALDNGINVSGKIESNLRRIILSTNNPKLPDVIVKQTAKADGKGYKGSIEIDAIGIAKFNSKDAELYAEMLQLAARLNLGIKEFIDNPEVFLGLIPIAKLQEVRNLAKATLLEINAAKMAQRNQQKQRTETRRYNDTVDAVQRIDEPEESESDDEKIEAKARQRKAKKQQEAEQFLQDNPEFTKESDDTIEFVELTPEIAQMY